MGSLDHLKVSAGGRLALWLGMALILGSGVAPAQGLPGSFSSRVPVSIASPAGSLPTATSQVLLELGSSASVIFAGQVLAIAPGSGFVEITFHVDRAVRSCATGGTFVLREWAGLWTSHPNRYRVGQHLLMFLTAQAASGLSAPVNVTDGAVPLLAPDAAPLLGPDGIAPPDTAVAPVLLVDLSWLQTRIARASAAALSNSQGAVAARAQTMTTGGWAGPSTPLSATTKAALTSVLALLLTGNGDSSDPR